MSPTTPENTQLRNIRRLIWLYFWLLILEGALRKWVLPQLANPLLIVRDPVLLAIFVLAIRARVFPMNGWMVSLGIIGFLCFAVTFVPLWPYLRPSRILLVDGYGFRSNFLHLPLIFVMSRVLRPEDLKKFGWWTLVILIPMTALMVAQFNAAPDAFLNRTAGGEGEMMTAALGKVRTAATFSFVTGVVAYFALATGFLIWAALKRDVYPSWLLFAAGTALVIGIAVSGSRSVVGACAVTAASLVIVLVLRPAAVNRFGQTVIVALVLGFVVTKTPIFREGFNVLSARFTEVAQATERSIGGSVLDRVTSDFSENWFIYTKAPFLGYGLGIGTNAGARFLTGRSMFLLSESEWSRIFLESGPVLGLAFVIWRCALVVRIGILCLRSVRMANVLPLLLFSSSAMPMAVGQFGQPTILGFAVFATGLALAARNENESMQIARAAPAAAVPRMVRSRSAYAERLHGAGRGASQTNGSVDR